MFHIKAVEILCVSITFFLENCALYEIMWIKMVESDPPQMTWWCMHIVCWITRATDKNSKYVTLLVFPWQQWVSECASLLSTCNTSCFSMATMVTWMCLNVMFYAQRLSCLKSEWQKKHYFSKQNSRTDHITISTMATLYTIIGNHIICYPFVCSHISNNK